MTHPPSLSRRVYVVGLSDRVVAMDVAETIELHDRTAQIVFASTPDDLDATLNDLDQIEMAIVEWTSSEAERTRLATAVTARGGRLVLVGDAAGHATTQERAQRWRVLMRPFVTEDILAALGFGPASGLTCG